MGGALDTNEMEQIPQAREPAMGDQEHQQPEIRELEPPSRELTLDRPPKEQTLRQTRLAESCPCPGIRLP